MCRASIPRMARFAARSLDLHGAAERDRRRPRVLRPRLARVDREAVLSPRRCEDIARREVAVRLELAHRGADDELVERVPKPRAVGALGRGREPRCHAFGYCAAMSRYVSAAA